jgi:hypothetical protein
MGLVQTDGRIYYEFKFKYVFKFVFKYEFKSDIRV